MRINKNIPFIIISLFLSISINSFAHSFERDGIYYKILSESNKTVEVTCRGIYDTDYDNEYTGSVTIPETVTYSGKTYSVTSIGGYAFSGCSGLTSVTIPNSVTSIGYEAFYGCSGLTSITIPNSITSIGYSAFYDTGWYNNQADGILYLDNCCLGYKGDSPTGEILLKEGTRLICGSAFSGCRGLTSVTIPNSVTSIGKEAFRACRGLKSVTIGNSVTSISDYAFYDCSGLKSVAIGNSVTSIGYEAFYGCSGLNSVTIPNSVTSIGAYAFEDCSGLISVTIPNSVTSIGQGAFFDCRGLTEVTIGNSVTSIGYHAFYGCRGLTEVNYNAENCTSMGSDDYPVFKDCTNMKTVIIGNSVKSIPHYAFRGCSGLTSVTIPNSVTSIGDHAFRGCSVLTSVTIGNSVTSIGYCAFSSCSGLTSVTIGNSVTSIGSDAFIYCNKLYQVINLSKLTLTKGSTNRGYVAYYAHEVINDGIIDGDFVWQISDNENKLIAYLENALVVNLPSDFNGKNYIIGNYAFSGHNIVEVTIPNSVTSIGESAFYNCSGLTSLTIGTGVLSIGTNAFSYYENNKYSNLDIKKVIWLTNTPPEGYKNVGSKAHYVSNNLYTGLSNVTIYPYLSSLFEVDGIKYVPVSPSERTCDAIDCVYDSSAANINIGNTISFRGVEMTLQDIKPYICYNNDYITDCKIKFNGNIGNYAFYDCDAVTNVEIETETIGTSAFQNCSLLKGVVIPDAVTLLGSSVFSGCSSLASVKIGSGISSIKEKTFYDCSSLTAITIPSNVTSIGNYVFDNCSSLAELTITDRETELSLGSNGSSPLFSDCPLKTVYIGGNITYPTSSGNGYSPFYSNKSLKNVILKNETNLTDYEFAGCKGLESIDFGNSINQFGSYVFYNCSSLEEVIIPNTVSAIGASAFEGCLSLASVKIGSEISSIKEKTFYDCSSLTAITIPANVTSIGNNVFGNCSSLEELTITDRDTELSLGSNGPNPLFSDCPLKSVYIGGNITYPTSSGNGYSPFYRNTSLETVIITDKETEISENEFYGCTALKNVSMGDGVETIGNWAFSGCSSLDSFSFGSGMKTIGTEAFSDCTAMTKLYSKAVLPPTCGSQALDDINKWNCELYVPQASIADYQAADQWKEFFFIKDIETGVEEVFVDGEDYSNAPIEIYNLSGLKVGDSTENLAPGVYIKRQGRKVEKIAIQ